MRNGISSLEAHSLRQTLQSFCPHSFSPGSGHQPPIFQSEAGSGTALGEMCSSGPTCASPWVPMWGAGPVSGRREGDLRLGKMEWPETGKMQVNREVLVGNQPQIRQEAGK